jgi:hypothetical protein
VLIFFGCQSLLTDVSPMWHEVNISGTLEDVIRLFGAPNSLFCDNAKSRIGKAVREILRLRAIKYFNVNHCRMSYTGR